jgi:hypothetical protein
MADFRLEPGGGRVGSKELAAMVAREDGRMRGLKGPELENFVANHAPTTQTIRNYAADGRLTAERDTAGQFVFDPAVAVAEFLANRKQSTHGGRRRKAGRRKAAPKPAAAFREAADYADTVERIRERATQGFRPVDAVDVTRLLNCTPDELRILLHHGAALGITPAGLDLLETTLKVQALERKQAVEAGKLIEADAALKAWGDKQRAVQGQINGLPARVADRVAQIAWVSPETVDRLVAELHAAGVPGATLDRVREALAVPGELTARVRAVIADEVRELGARVASGRD